MTYVEHLNQIYQLSRGSDDVHVWNVSESVGDDGVVRHAILPDEILTIPWNGIDTSDRWQGLAHFSGGGNGENALIASKGRDQLFIMVPSIDLHLLRIVDVADFFGNSISGLKELELVDDHLDEEMKAQLTGYVFANEAGTDNLHMIDLNLGIATRTWTLGMLRGEVEDHFEDTGREDDFDLDDHYLNGIAYDKHRDTFLLTGSEWGAIFELRLDYKRILGYY